MSAGLVAFSLLSVFGSSSGAAIFGARGGAPRAQKIDPDQEFIPVDAADVVAEEASEAAALVDTPAASGPVASFLEWLSDGPTSDEKDGTHGEFLVDSAWLKTLTPHLSSPGLAYRNSPRLSDWKGGSFAKWGSKVNGTVEHGWLKTAQGYLPLRVKGRKVLDKVEEASQSIIASVSSRTWWGFPSYVKYLDTGLESWNELARLHGHLGNACTAQTVLKQCGTALICTNNGVCGECQMSRDCPEKFLCQQFPASGRKMCVRRDLAEQWTWREGIATALIIFTAMLSAAAGMGGGGVFVPLLLLLLGFSTKEAVPLSQAMIVGGAIVNILFFSGHTHPKYPMKPKIDYDVVMMLNPGLAAGVTVGVMLNVISPQWIIVLVLNVTLVIALQKSLTKGIASFKKESKMLEEKAAAAKLLEEQQRSEGGGGDAVVAKPSAKAAAPFVDLKSFIELAGRNQTQMSLIVSCWLVFLVGNVLKAPQCSTMYWLQLVGLLLLCVVFTEGGAQVMRGQMEKAQAQGGSSEGMLNWTPTTLYVYPLLSVAAGFLGGFLGIGGGIIMGPLLLELGMAAEASQATTAMFVFLSSSLATIQFIILGKAMPQFAMWFTTWVILSTIVGQTIIDYVLKVYQRTSLIVLSVAAIIAGSLIMMTVIGAKDTYTDVMREAPMGFAPMNLCY